MREKTRLPDGARVRRFAAALLTFVWPGTWAQAAPPPDAAAFFETRVRPVLVDSCGKCHGPTKQASGLRLDTRAALLEGGLNGPAVVPGDPDASLLVQVVRQTHEDLKMPPKGKLPETAVEAIAGWVKMGAPWPENAKTVTPAGSNPASAHWAFRPVKAESRLPAVKDAAWVRTPVDAFILARLETAGLTPSPGADRRTLIRRLSFDLTGLPPTPEAVEAFVKDPRPDAFERLADDLLASPSYGERWGRHWLDVARYADTKGYVFTEDRNYPYSYTYRDYVIRAFNEDKPYDRFVTEQVAADRIKPETDRSSLAALGFLTVGRRYLNNNEDILDDRIDVVTRGFLGLTVACARCHDHKFDPIPTDDYYSLYGVFASSVEPADLPEIPAPVPAAMRDDFRVKLAEAQKVVDDFLFKTRAEAQDDLRSRAALYLRAALDVGFSPVRRDPKVDERARADKLAPGRLRAFSARWNAKLDETRGSRDPVFAAWHAFASLPAGEFAGKATEAAKALSADPKACNPVLARSFTEMPPKSMAEVAGRYGDLMAEAGRKWVAASRAGAQALDDPNWDALRRVLQADDGPFGLPGDALMRVLDQGERNTLTEKKTGVNQLKATHPGSPPRAMALNDVPNPVEPHVFLRGNPGRPGNVVPRRFLKVLSGPDRKPFTDGSGRLDLARAIVSRDNPLTARVMVNRVWLNHFGSGLVETPSDFGVRSDPPSHPELLDWLADDFMRNGWSVKALHRRIVLSSTYRQRSENRPEALAKDPVNRLHWKFNRRRLEFEAMRDALLAVSGSLDATMGGRSLPINDPPYPPRRTVYGYIDRLALDGAYRTFDFASPDASSPRRLVTTVPQQALFLMNSPFVIGQARRLAGRGELAAGPPEVRVAGLYERLFGREPNPQELALGITFVRKQDETGPSLPPPPWAYGYARFDPATAAGHRVEFRPMPHWTGSGWQFGPNFPHPEGFHAQWNAAGGHAGHDKDHAVVLRWKAPRDAVVRVEGILGHPNPQGDGVRGLVVSSRDGILGDWVCHATRVPTPVSHLEVRRGETLDFVVDCRHDDAFDGFAWAPVVREEGSAGEVWDAKAGFHGPPATGLTPWEEYAQVLLLTNEFVFVD